MTPEAMLKLAKVRWEHESTRRGQIEKIIALVMPYREASGETTAKDNFDQVFDSTAMNAAMRFAGRMADQLQDPVELEPGPTLTAEQREALAPALKNASRIVAGGLATGEWVNAAHEVSLDLLTGQGACLVLPGDDEDIVQFMPCPTVECCFQEDARGKISFVGWRRSLERAAVFDAWPGAEAKIAAAEGKTKSQTSEPAGQTARLTVWHMARRVGSGVAVKWIYQVVVDLQDGVLLDELSSKTCPFLTPRFYKVPGMARGFGPLDLIYPDARVVSKGKEMLLRKAAVDLMGIYTWKGDGVFSPEMASFEPGAFWEVGSMGGPFGASVQRMDVGGPMDLTLLGIENAQEAIREGLVDRAEVPEDGKVRSPTEIVSRARRIVRDWQGVAGRLIFELVVPLHRRMIEIMIGKKLLNEALKIDHLQIQVKIISVLTASQRLAEVERITEYLQMVGGLLGPEQMALGVAVEDVPEQLGRIMNVPPELLRTKDARTRLQQMAAQIAQGPQSPESMP
jgi:hypothetical protein